MKNAFVIRSIFIGLLWCALCYIFASKQLASGEPFTLRTAFIIIASGIVVFVPLYKKYKRTK